jgi:hypothetical protein
LPSAESLLADQGFGASAQVAADLDGRRSIAFRAISLAITG